MTADPIASNFAVNFYRDCGRGSRFTKTPISNDHSRDGESFVFISISSISCQKQSTLAEPSIPLTKFNHSMKMIILTRRLRIIRGFPSEGYLTFHFEKSMRKRGTQFGFEEHRLVRCVSRQIARQRRFREFGLRRFVAHMNRVA